MATTTVKTQIVVQFDDQFTDAANRATENYFKSFNEAQQKLESVSQDFEPFYQEYFENMRKGFDELNTFSQMITVLGSAGLFAGFFIAGPELFVLIGAIGLGVEGFYALWSQGLNLDRWLIGGKPFEGYVEGVKESLEQLSNSESIGLPPIPEETVRSLEITKSYLEQIQNMQDIFITVNLVDNATKEAKQLREKLEAIFSEDIIQRITIFEETIQTTIPSSFSDADSTSGSSFDSSGGFGDAGGFDGGSVDSGGFNAFSPSISVPGFASGIDRVPRDMFALNHKDETILPKDRAEDFRRGGSSGMAIQNLNFSFNVPNGLKLDREEFRDLAFMMRDELKRLDQRIN